MQGLATPQDILCVILVQQLSINYTYFETQYIK